MVWEQQAQERRDLCMAPVSGMSKMPMGNF